MPVVWFVTPPDSELPDQRYKLTEISFDGKDIVAVTGSDAVMQRIEQRLRFLLGSWFLDTREGVPWFTKILGARNDLLAGSIIRRTIAETPGVKSVASFGLDWNRSTRELSIAFESVLDTGQILTAQAKPFIFEEVKAA